MFTATLFGTPSCRRYQKMRKLVVEEAARLDLSIQIEEISETAQLTQFNPLSTGFHKTVPSLVSNF